MADDFEFIIRAIDSASDVFKEIIDNARGMASDVVESITGAGDEFETVSSEAMNFNDVIDGVDDSSIQALADDLGLTTDEVSNLLSVGADLGNIAAGFSEDTEAVNEFDDAVNTAKDDLDGINNSAGDVMVAQTFREMSEGIAGSMMEAVNSAGSFNDSINRASLEAEGFGISADEMKSVVSSLSEETGRAGGQIRESFIKATARGVTDMGSFQTMMKGAGAQAYLLGTDIQTMGDKFSSMAQKDTIMTRALAETGITMDELGKAMGLTGATADEVKDKWKELDTNQRAAILGTAASMNEGKNANDEYKNSWQGLQDQLDVAKGKLIKNIGNIILPVVIPAMELAQRVLDGVGTTIDGLMKGPAAGFISVLGTMAGGFLIAVTAAGFLKQMLGFLRIEEMITSGAQTVLNIQNALFGETTAAATAASKLQSLANEEEAISFWAVASAELAALWPLALIVAAIIAVVAVVYELGKAFGWWTDVSSMIDHIWDGLNRLWNAFINHPDVQAVISVISSAWNWLISSIQGVITAVADFFGINSSGNFDIVRALIDSIGQAWNAITLPIRVVFRLLQTLWSAFDGANGGIDILGGLSWAWENLMNVINTVWTAVEPIFTLSSIIVLS